MSLNDILGAVIVVGGVISAGVFIWGCIGMDKRDPDWWSK